MQIYFSELATLLAILAVVALSEPPRWPFFGWRALRRERRRIVRPYLDDRPGL